MKLCEIRPEVVHGDGGCLMLGSAVQMAWGEWGAQVVERDGYVAQWAAV